MTHTTVRAKFKVSNIVPNENSQTVSLHPVYSEDPNHENKKFWDATPAGSLTMTINNTNIHDFFVLNSEYYIDITQAQTEEKTEA